jgi:flagellar motor switch protein FliM
VSIQAVLDEQRMTLQDVLNFKVGTRLMLNASPSTEVELRCGPVPMFRGRMGRRGNNIAIAVDRVLNKQARQG